MKLQGKIGRKISSVLGSIILIVALGATGLNYISDGQYSLENIINGVTGEVSNNSNSDANNSNNKNKNDSIKISDSSINELINDVKIEEASNDEYDRDSYTSTSQLYTYKGQRYYSIRNYGFYVSKWYDGNNNIYNDPYNGSTTNEVKGLDWDHVVPLHYVNQHGGSKWSESDKKAFADNPEVGVNVNAHDNRSKSDKGPAEWLPSKNIENYCYTWLVICDKYNISVTPEDMQVIKEKLANVKDYSKLQNLCEYKN